MIKVAIVGGTGYTGVELLRLLAGHSEVEVSAISSRSEAGRSVAELYPNLRGHFDRLVFEDPANINFSALDLVFFATPHGVAQSMMKSIFSAGPRVIDLSADFRIRDQQIWESWYGQPHQCPELIAEAVYGLPEVNRAAIADARLIAAPGCYPTSVQLAMLPLLKQNLVDASSIIASSGSGVSGAGRSAKVPFLLTEASENFKAYATGGHRHEPEIQQGLQDILGDEGDAKVLFLPHLVPMIRGIHSTVIANIKLDQLDNLSQDSLQSMFERYYINEPFVDVLPMGSNPETRTVKGTNICRLAVYKRDNRIVVLAVEDNLTKGASGQAIQCMNIMFGFGETSGLQQPALLP